jgi:hypothetical protein
MRLVSAKASSVWFQALIDAIGTATDQHCSLPAAPRTNGKMKKL